MSGRPGSARVTMKKHVYLLPGREETFADNLAKSIESLGLTLCGREIVRDFARLRFAEQLALIKSDLQTRSEEHTSELQSQSNLVCRLLLEKKKYIHTLLSGGSTNSYSSTHLSLYERPPHSLVLRQVETLIAKIAKRRIDDLLDMHCLSIFS